MVATQRNSIDLVKWLVEKGADITIKSKYGGKTIYNCSPKQ